MNGLGLVQLIQWGSQLKGFKSKAGTSSPEEKEVPTDYSYILYWRIPTCPF